MRVQLSEREVDAVQPGAAEQILRCLDVADLVIVLTPDGSPIYVRERILETP